MLQSSGAANPQQLLQQLQQVQQMQQMQFQPNAITSPTFSISNGTILQQQNSNCNNLKTTITNVESTAIEDKITTVNDAIMSNHAASLASVAGAAININSDNVIGLAHQASASSEFPDDGNDDAEDDFCDSVVENFYGNVIGVPSEFDSKNAADMLNPKQQTSLDYSEMTEKQLLEKSAAADVLPPVPPKERVSDLAYALHETQNQLFMKPQSQPAPPASIQKEKQHRGFATDLATQLGMLVLRERQKQQQEQQQQQDHLQQFQQLFELQQINHQRTPSQQTTNAGLSSNTSPDKDPTRKISHSASIPTHKKQGHNTKSLKVRHTSKHHNHGSCEGSEHGSIVSSLSKAASMSELDAPPCTTHDPISSNGNLSHGADILASSTAEHRGSSGNIENVAIDSVGGGCYNRRPRKHKKYQVGSNTATEMGANDGDSCMQGGGGSHSIAAAATTTAITPFCRECAFSSLSSKKKKFRPTMNCDIVSIHHHHQASHPPTTYDSITLQHADVQELQPHELQHTCGSSNKANESLQPLYDNSGATMCGTSAKKKKYSMVQHREQSHDNRIPHQPHQQQQHFTHHSPPQHHPHNHPNHHPHNHHHHGKSNSSAVVSASYHHHRSQGQLLIDDADLLHQCLVSLAGERNVALLLKRFQQRPQSPEQSNGNSPC